MNNKNLQLLLTIFLVLANMILMTIVLVYAKSFLIPFVTAIILAMIMNPIFKKLNNWGVPRTLAILISDLIIVLFISLMGFLLISQVNRLADNWPEIERKIHPELVQFEEFIAKNFNIKGLPDLEPTGADSTANNQNHTQSDNRLNDSEPLIDLDKGIFGFGRLLSSETVRDNVIGAIEAIVGMFSSLVLILVYIFFFMLFQNKFQNAMLGFFPKHKQEQVKDIIAKSAKTTQDYLLGRFLLVIILAVLYAISFTIIGMKYSILVALIASLFSLIPYIGNVIGFAVAVAVSFSSGGDVGQFVAIAIIFTIFQLVENNILEPFVVGDSVDLNPLVVIIGVVVGGMVWGMMGMLLAIPVFGIMRAVSNNIEMLKPIGYLLDSTDTSEGTSKFHERVVKIFKKKKKGK